MPQFSDTIFALSSGRPPAAIAVIRISGPRAGDALRTLIGRALDPRKAVLARLRDPASGEIIDEALVLWFPGPASETGEDIAELQVHGGRAIIAGVLAALARIDGLRPAEAGEFTRRAFENGKLDLTRVEGLADLIAADTQAQRRQALRQLQGLLGHKADDWRRRLIEARALIEARIDFPDEGDVPQDLLAGVLANVATLREEIAAALTGAARSERIRDGMVVAIAGPPNAGKSSLMNRLARREVAIVSEFAGTTRDVIEAHLDLAGYPVTLLDTAGVRASKDPVEQEGVRRAQARAAAADLVLWVIEAGRESDSPGESREAPRATEVTTVAPARWLVVNKIDRPPNIKSNNRNIELSNIDDRNFQLSALTGEGIDGLLTALTYHAAAFFGSGEAGFVTRERHRHNLAGALAALERISSEAAPERDDIIAEELRLAADFMGRLTGRIDVEDVLDVIFRDFCIGK